VFPSADWCRAALALANQDPELPAALAGFTSDVGVAVLTGASAAPAALVLHLRPQAGQLALVALTSDLDLLDELDGALVARAPYAVWKALLQGTLDPIEAVLTRRVQVQGDVQPIIERVRFGGIVDRVLAQLETTFIDEGAQP